MRGKKKGPKKKTKIFLVMPQTIFHVLAQLYNGELCTWFDKLQFFLKWQPCHFLVMVLGFKFKDLFFIVKMVYIKKK